MRATPCTTVQKMMGAINIRIALMNASPSGCIAAPVDGRKIPSRIPTAIARITWVQSCLYQGFVVRGGAVVITARSYH
jgi:hypothetical protein